MIRRRVELVTKCDEGESQVTLADLHTFQTACEDAPLGTTVFIEHALSDGELADTLSAEWWSET